MSIIRKPHNLITYYWDDMEYFLSEAEKSNDIYSVQNSFYKIALKSIPDNEEVKIKVPNLPVFDKRNIRFCILSSFLFLEAFINGEYFESLEFKNTIRELNPSQIQTLESEMVRTYFDEKWSRWVALFMKDPHANLKGDLAFQNMKKLKEWRNRLTHYKIQELMEIAHDVQCIENAREAKRIVVDVIAWYYSKTKRKIPDWVRRDILSTPQSQNL
ncbi:hypothetical protein SAMN05428975_0419 [Mucilaginibacter sp. OK268]|uniref:hypothetical protein n=1 Tax=Mucilaginibacter sp. OK268 TaxID=1881048 RepID=UPI000882D285|nr:hypothetical protein [Mucilaginibacter sp. OK268]SDP13086.1 hypothetical protein SAMN05428975_0419 [Mucilaginibacter sp. OK268]